MPLTLGDTLTWAARYLPAKEAIVVNVAGQPRQAWTYAQLEAEVNRHARALQALEVGAGDVVAALLYNTPTFVFTLLAAARLGAVFNPIHDQASAAELAFVLEDGKAKALVFDADRAEVVQQARALTSNTPHWIYAEAHDAPGAQCATTRLQSLLRGLSSEPLSVAVREDAACVLLYTSGTTGRPKGVLHTHRSKLTHNALMHQVLQMRREDVGLSMAPLNHTGELHTSFLPRLQMGATQVLQRRFDAADALRLIEAEGVTCLYAAPSMCAQLLHAPELAQHALASLRVVAYGGAAMAPQLIRQWYDQVGCDLVQIYGTTEMGPCMSVLYPHEQLIRPGSAGLPVLNHDLVVAQLHSDGTPSDPAMPCAVGEVGEILVKGPCMMAGYLNRADANAHALAHGWYHTGDLGLIDADGYLWIRDRREHLVRTAEGHVYPREVEDVLLTHPSVLQAAVVGAPDGQGGQQVEAYVVAIPGASISAAALQRFVAEQSTLAAYQHPRRYHWVDALPQTSSGKVQKHLLHLTHPTQGDWLAAEPATTA